MRYPARRSVTWADGTQANVLSIGREGVNIAVNPSVAAPGGSGGCSETTTTSAPMTSSGATASVQREADRERRAVRRDPRTGPDPPRRLRPQLAHHPGAVAVRLSARQEHAFLPGPRIPACVHVPARAPRSTPPAAARACAGVGDALRVGCEIDFGATGDRRLVIATRALQQSAGLPPATVNLSGRWSGEYGGASRDVHPQLETVGTATERHDQALQSPYDPQHPRDRERRTIRFGEVGGVAYSGALTGDSMSGTYRVQPRRRSWSATKIS